MISVQEAINKVDNFKEKNQVLIEIIKSEIEKEIEAAAEKGYRKKEICIYPIWTRIEKQFGVKLNWDFAQGIKEIIIRDLRENGFRINIYRGDFEVLW